jgi:hypothetical protein
LLARIATLRGDAATAWCHLDAALAQTRRLDNTRAMASLLETAACAFRLDGEYESAVRALAASDMRATKMLLKRGPQDAAAFAGCAASLRESLGDAAYDDLWDEGRNTPIQEAVDAVLGTVSAGV